MIGPLRRIAGWSRDSAPLFVLLLASLTMGSVLEGEGREQALRALRRSGGRPLIAYLVVRPRDCESHLELLRLLERPGLTRYVTNGGALLVGRGDAAPTLAMLARELPGTPARRASLLERHLLARLHIGHAPTLVLFDTRTGAVRLAARAPLAAVERVRFLAALSAAASLYP